MKLKKLLGPDLTAHRILVLFNDGRRKWLMDDEGHPQEFPTREMADERVGDLNILAEETAATWEYEAWSPTPQKEKR